MGEIADGLINGDFDSVTGEYLGEGMGFPRTKIGSFYSKKRKSEDLSWRKVPGFLNNIKIKGHLHPQVLKDFGCKYTGKKPFRNACFEVLKTFEEFKKFATSWEPK